MMDRKTLTALLNEAKKNYSHSKKQFDKYDNSEDMHEMNQWSATIVWLEGKLIACR